MDTLFLIYTTVLIAFGLSYVVLEEMGFAVLKEDGESLNAHSFQLVEVCLYFSAVTLLSVGYGAISPTVIIVIRCLEVKKELWERVYGNRAFYIPY